MYLCEKLLPSLPPSLPSAHPPYSSRAPARPRALPPSLSPSLPFVSPVVFVFVCSRACLCLFLRRRLCFILIYLTRIFNILEIDNSPDAVLGSDKFSLGLLFYY